MPTTPSRKRLLWAPVVLLASLAPFACGSSEPDSDPASASDDAASEDAITESTGGPPVVCGTPEDEAATDEQIAALEGCTTYRGSLALLGDATTVSPLSSLRILEGRLFVGGTNSPLTTLAGLEQLESVGEFIANSHNLSDLVPLQGLTQVTGNLTVFSMFNLQDLRGLENLRVVEGDFKLFANPMLTSVAGLEGLETVGGDFEATSTMTPLPRAEVQALLDRVEVGGMVYID